MAGVSDGELLGRFVGHRDEAGEAAFAALMARHGPMVLGVCRRALSDPNDVADAFQATFLVLVRKARSVRVEDSLGRWLYGVSRKVAGRARSNAGRRPRDGVGLEHVASRTSDPDGFEWKGVLDEELARLPATFRAAIVLCDLEGVSIEAAARDLACPVGTIKSRLARGRRKLRERLERRGMTPSLMSSPIVPAALAEATARSASLLSTPGSTLAGVVPASALALTQEVLKVMNAFSWKFAAAAACSLGLVATGAGVVARGPIEGEPPAKVAREAAAPEPAQAQSRLARLEQELAKARGTVAQVEKLAKAPGDPAARRPRRRVDELEAALAQIDQILTSALDTPDAAKDGPGRLPGAGTPREGDKVSMPQYVVEAPDILIVEVQQALPDRPITGEHLVQPDGRITLGNYGQVFVAGLTVDQIKAKIADHLRDFLDDEQLGIVQKDPKTGVSREIEPSRSTKIFVNVASYNSKFYYVMGDVGSPGRLHITGNETVLDAINLVGGLIPMASRPEVRLVRPMPAGNTSLPVDLDAIIKQGDTKTNYQLFPGDRLIVARQANDALAEPDDVEARLKTVEQKLDEVLEVLKQTAKL